MKKILLPDVNQKFMIFIIYIYIYLFVDYYIIAISRFFNCISVFLIFVCYLRVEKIQLQLWRKNFIFQGLYCIVLIVYKITTYTLYIHIYIRQLKVFFLTFILNEFLHTIKISEQGYSFKGNSFFLFLFKSCIKKLNVNVLPLIIKIVAHSKSRRNLFPSIFDGTSLSNKRANETLSTGQSN